MTKLSMVDLQFLHLGIKGNGRFDEKDVEHSKLKKLGVGRILDQLASLKERNLIEMNEDGSFSITNLAKNTVWENSIPLWVKILRLLEIKSQTMDDIVFFLSQPSEQIQNEIEDLRKRQLVLMSPLRDKTGIVKMYEILPEGIERLEQVQNNGFATKLGSSQPHIEILSIMEETIEDIKSIPDISEDKKEKIISNLTKIMERLRI